MAQLAELPEVNSGITQGGGKRQTESREFGTRVEGVARLPPRPLVANERVGGNPVAWRGCWEGSPSPQQVLGSLRDLHFGKHEVLLEQKMT